MAKRVPNPDRERTERGRELKRLRDKGEPGPERAQRAAELAVAFHEDRSLNDVMVLAQMVLGDVDDGVPLLVDAYLEGTRGPEDRMERLAMLANLARWIDGSDLEGAAREAGVSAASEWCGAVVDELERAERLSVVERRFDADLRRAVQQRLQAA